MTDTTDSGSTDSTDTNIMQWKDLGNSHNCSLLLKPLPNLELFLNQFNNTTPENSNDSENIFSPKYYDIDKMHNIKITQKIDFYPFFI